MSQELPDSKGKDFWLAFMPNYHNYKNSSNNYLRNGDSLYIFIVASEPTKGKIEYKDVRGNELEHEFEIFDVTRIHIFQIGYDGFEIIGAAPSHLDLGTSQNENIALQSFHITSEKEITVYAHQQANTTSDAFIVLPTDALWTDYFVMSYESHDVDIERPSYTPSQFMIVATEDGTDVRIEPRAPTAYNGLATQNIVMNKGDVYLVQANISSGNNRYDMSGSLVESSKPVAVFGGHMRSYLPISNNADNPSRDMLVEQMPPVNSWGKNALIVPYPQPSNITKIGSDIYRVIAAYNDTELFIDDKYATKLNRGEVYQRVLNGPAKLEATSPILVAQFKKTSSTSFNQIDPVIGDPFMMIIPQVEQFGNFYRCINVQAAEFNYMNGTKPVFEQVYEAQYITIVAPNTTLSTVKVDNIPVPVLNFIPIPTSDYSYAIVKVTDGAHTVEAEEDIGIYVYGYGVANSYGYFGGMNFKKLDYSPPEITSNDDCFKVKGTVYDSTFNDTRISQVKCPDNSKVNVDVQIENFVPYPDSVGFNARLLDIYFDGEFMIDAADSAGLRSSKTIEIPGFTLRTVSTSTGLPTKVDTVRIGREYCYSFAVENYGKFQQEIRIENFSNTSGVYKTSSNLPKIIAPGAVDSIKICFYTDIEGSFIDTLLMGNNCHLRSMYKMAITAIDDKSKPGILAMEDPCMTKYEIIVSDSLRTDYGIQSVSVPKSVNCNVEKSIFNNKKMIITAEVIDPYQDASFEIIVTDSAGNENKFEQIIPGFTLSILGGSADSNMIRFGGNTIGKLNCDTISLHNYGEYKLTFEDSRMFENILFSVPQFQFPIEIEPGETIPMEVCYRALHSQRNAKEIDPDIDTLFFDFNCQTLRYPMSGYGMSIMNDGDNRCNNAVRITIDNVNPGFFVDDNYPDPFSEFTEIKFGIPENSEVSINVFDLYGKKVMNIDNGRLEKGVYSLRFDLSSLESGTYYYQVNAGNNSGGGLMIKAE